MFDISYSFYKGNYRVTMKNFQGTQEQTQKKADEFVEEFYQRMGVKLYYKISNVRKLDLQINTNNIPETGNIQKTEETKKTNKQLTKNKE